MDKMASYGGSCGKAAPSSSGAYMGRVALFCLIAFAAISLASPSPAPAAGAEEEGVVSANPHDFNAEDLCSVCHRGEPPALNLDPVATCTKCHPGNVANHPVARHPLGKMPGISVPAYLPLSQNGKMVCFTCHDPHNRSGIENMLRVRFQKLCASCHAGY